MHNSSTRLIFIKEVQVHSSIRRGSADSLRGSLCRFILIAQAGMPLEKLRFTRMVKRSEGAQCPSLAVQRSTITKASVSAQAEMLDLDEQNTATPRAKTWDTAIRCYLIAGEGIGAVLFGNSLANATDRQKAGMADIGSSETVCQAE